MKKFILVLVLVLAVSVYGFSQPVQEETAEVRYVASTSWVAAIAELSGLDGVVSIAPAELKHPPEYEIVPDDMVRVINADLFMYAGYEKMMSTIGTAAQVDQAKVLKVTTTNTLENLEKMVELISGKAGTEELAAERFGAYRQMIEESMVKIRDLGLDKIEVWANTNQAQLARDLGLNVVSTFGAGPLTSDQIAEAASKKYVLAIDNIHNPVASPIAEVSPETVVLTWRNFPDHLGGDALYNVISDNLEMLFDAFEK